MFGFDLDNARSPTTRPAEGAPHCAHGDFSSMLDQDQNGDAMGRACAAGSAGCIGGVDNQLPSFVDALGQFMPGLDVNRLLNERINRGAGLLLVRVSGVNGMPGPQLCDPEVTLRIYRVYPLFADCTGVQSPNQMYAIASSSLVNPSDPSSARATLPGSVVNGRVRVHPHYTLDASSSVRIDVPFGGADLAFDLYNPQLRMTLNSNGSASDGNLGGVELKRSLLAGLIRHPFFPPSADVLGSLLDGFVDVATPIGHPGARCIGLGPSGAEEGGLGIGLGFSALPATLVERVLDSAPSGACGAIDAGVVTDGGPTCASPQTSCGGVCVNTRTDAQNCGICGLACPVGQACSGGVCTAGGTATAGRACTSATDPSCGSTLRCQPFEGMLTCTGACTNSTSQTTERSACGGNSATCLILDATTGGGFCTAACTAGAGMCRAGWACSTRSLSQQTPDTAGCFPFCTSNSQCTGGTACNTRTGFCGAAANLTRLADGSPCNPSITEIPPGETTPRNTQCRGLCYRASATSMTQGVCGSLINLANSHTCPDPGVQARGWMTDEIGICIFRDCTRNADCTGTLRCVYPETSGVPNRTQTPFCSYATTAQPGGIP